jgi:hypothetical protein
MVSAIRGAGLLASVGVLMSAGPAHALCAYSEVFYQGGAYGAYAVASGCSVGLDQGGGALSTTASASTTISTPYVDASSSADLTLGALAAYSAAGSASSALWDTFTYSGLPIGGASVEATLSLPGTLTGFSHGSAELQEGTEAELGDGSAASYFAFFDSSSNPKPASISLVFNVMNGVPETVFSEIVAFGDGTGGIADLADPPTLSLTVPLGASVMSASGVFDNFTASSAVPEPATWAMMLLGFVGLGYAGYRRARAA